MPGQARMGNHKGYLFWQSFLFIFTLLLAVYVLFRSPLFLIGQIDVQGNSLLNRHDIIRASGIVTGMNIFQADLHQATTNIATMPMVKEVHINRRYPGTIVINVAERVPVALVAYNESFIELSATGHYLRPGRVGITGLPVLTGIAVQNASPGQIVQAGNLTAALQVVQELPDELKASLSEVHMSADGGVILYTLDGIACRLGLPEQVYQKGDYFLQVKRELMEIGKNIDYVDFSIVSYPVVKYKR